MAHLSVSIDDAYPLYKLSDCLRSWLTQCPIFWKNLCLLISLEVLSHIYHVLLCLGELGQDRLYHTDHIFADNHNVIKQILQKMLWSNVVGVHRVNSNEHQQHDFMEK